MKQLSENSYQINYGKDYNSELLALLGEPIENAHFMNGGYREIPETTYELHDRRIVIIVSPQLGYRDIIYIYPNFEAYDIYEHNRKLLEWDWENRGGRNSYSQKIMWLYIWLKEHPGQRIPTNPQKNPELWHYDKDCKLCREGKILHSETVKQ